MKKIFSFILSLIIFWGFVIVLNNNLENKINEMYSKKISSMYGSTIKNKGQILQNISIKKENLMMYGSSELGVHIEQNPVSFFPTKSNNFDVDVIGRGYCQNLGYAINFAALNDKLSNKKGAYIISLQWFSYSKDGISAENFLMNFSPYQFLSMIDNKKISKKNKKRICERVYDLTKSDNNFYDINLYCNLYSSDNFFDKAMLIMLKPYYEIKKTFFRTKDNIDSYNLVKDMGTQNKSKNNKQLKDKKWHKEYEKAEAQGKLEVNNNEFYINNKYFDKYYRKNLDKLKGSSKNDNLNKTKEFDDLNLMLDICKEINFRPMFVLMPTNGRWYDYIGIDKEKREAFYDKAANIIRQKGFDVFTYQKYEYTPYFMKDGMHLGWKGWLKVDETISKYFSENKK